MSLTDAIKVCRDFSQHNPRFRGSGPKTQIKKVEHAVGTPFLRQQRIFNDAVVIALERLAKTSDRVDEIVAGHTEQAAHDEGIAALRRDLVELQQEVARLRAELAGSSGA